MSQNKKYELKIAQKNDNWSAKIIRKVSKHKTRVTLSKKGFSSESEAREWAEQEVQILLKKHYEKQKSKKEAEITEAPVTTSPPVTTSEE